MKAWRRFDAWNDRVRAGTKDAVVTIGIAILGLIVVFAWALSARQPSTTFTCEGTVEFCRQVIAARAAQP